MERLPLASSRVRGDVFGNVPSEERTKNAELVAVGILPAVTNIAASRRGDR